jgi:hypothetical protein
MATAMGRIADENLDVATSSLFLNPQKKSTQLLTKLSKETPAAVIALDQIFWFAYGRKELSQRLHDVGAALDLLQNLKFPVFLGDVPRMRGVSRTMLPPERIPSQEHTDRVNELIHARCKQAPNLHLLPLVAWSNAMNTGQSVKLNGKAVTYKKSQLFLSDGLHVNRRGLALITLLVLETLVKEGLLHREAISISTTEPLSIHLQSSRFEVRVEDANGTKVKTGEITLDVTALESQFPSTEFSSHPRLRRLMRTYDLSIRNPFFIRSLPSALIGKPVIICNKKEGTRSKPIILKPGSTRAVVTLK